MFFFQLQLWQSTIILPNCELLQHVIILLLLSITDTFAVSFCGCGVATYGMDYRLAVWRSPYSVVRIIIPHRPYYVRTQVLSVVTGRVAWSVGLSVCLTREPCKNG